MIYQVNLPSTEPISVVIDRSAPRIDLLVEPSSVFVGEFLFKNADGTDYDFENHYMIFEAWKENVEREELVRVSTNEPVASKYADWVFWQVGSTSNSMALTLGCSITGQLQPGDVIKYQIVRDRRRQERYWPQPIQDKLCKGYIKVAVI